MTSPTHMHRSVLEASGVMHQGVVVGVDMRTAFQLRLLQMEKAKARLEAELSELASRHALLQLRLSLAEEEEPAPPKRLTVKQYMRVQRQIDSLEEELSLLRQENRKLRETNRLLRTRHGNARTAPLVDVESLHERSPIAARALSNAVSEARREAQMMQSRPFEKRPPPPPLPSLDAANWSLEMMLRSEQIDLGSLAG